MAAVLRQTMTYGVIFVLFVPLAQPRDRVTPSRDVYGHFELRPQIVSDELGQSNPTRAEIYENEFSGRLNDPEVGSEVTEEGTALGRYDKGRDSFDGRPMYEYRLRKLPKRIFYVPKWSVQKHSSSSTAASEIAKNRFTPWGGKRSDLDSDPVPQFPSTESGFSSEMETKRDFHPWGGKRRWQLV